MEIADLRKADAAKKAALKAKADKYLAESQAKPEAAVESTFAVGNPSALLPGEVVLCGSCKHWERQDAKTVFAACGLSRHSGLPVAMATTDRMTCSRAEKR